MADLIFISLTLAFVALCALYVRACDAIVRSTDEVRAENASEDREPAGRP